MVTANFEQSLQLPAKAASSSEPAPADAASSCSHSEDSQTGHAQQKPSAESQRGIDSAAKRAAQKYGLSVPVLVLILILLNISTNAGYFLELRNRYATVIKCQFWQPQTTHEKAKKELSLACSFYYEFEDYATAAVHYGNAQVLAKQLGRPDAFSPYYQMQLAKCLFKLGQFREAGSVLKNIVIRAEADRRSCKIARTFLRICELETKLRGGKDG